MKSPFRWMSPSAIYAKYSKDPGNMLVHTGVIGWALSSAAQIFAIAINDKISPKEKMFLIPQEIADAVVNCLSFYTFTNGIKFFGKKLTQTGKLRTAEVTKLLKDRGLILEKGAERVKGKVYAGDWNFNITKLADYKTHIEEAYKPFNNGVEVITGLVGSILSSNLITPVFRNHYAAYKQKELLKRSGGTKPAGEVKAPTAFTPQKTSFANYQKIVSSRVFPSGDMKI